MTAVEVWEAIQGAGGSLSLNGDRIKYSIPKPAEWLVAELRQQRGELLEILRERETIPVMPPGVRLVSWKPKQPPVVIPRLSVVTAPVLFARRTFEQLDAALRDKSFLAGNWSIPELVDRLEQVGVVVRIEGSRKGDQYG